MGDVSKAAAYRERESQSLNQLPTPDPSFFLPNPVIPCVSRMVSLPPESNPPQLCQAEDLLTPCFFPQQEFSSSIMRSHKKA